MHVDYIEINERYQHRETKRIGRAVLISGHVATLQDECGDNFRVDIASLEYAPVYKFDEYWIDLNVNYPKDTANAFLCRKDPMGGQTNSGFECIGEAQLESCGEYQGLWKVDVIDIYDAETGGDCRILGYFECQNSALQALWDEREKIIS